METVSMDSGFTVKSIGSETARAPFGMVKSGLPEKVTVLSVLVSIEDTPTEPLVGRATVTAVMGRSVVPKTLEMRIRMGEPPMDMCSVWRMVEFTNTAPVWF